MKAVTALLLCLSVAAYAKRDLGEGTVVAAGNPEQTFPLKHTEVKASLAGGVASVEVTQVFQNPCDKPIEAVYQFPLPDDAAVDDLVVRLGERTIRGVIKKRAEAKKEYEAAKDEGKFASLLDQERPNIFTQFLANVLPGERIEVTIHYVAPLAYSDGAFEFVFSMVVGPRYEPTSMDPKDAARVAPRTPPAATRTGADIQVQATLEAGLEIRDLASKSHEIDVTRISPSLATVRLRASDTIPNKDFCLRWKVAGGSPQAALLTRGGPEGGFFQLTVHPQAVPAADEVAPRELVFLVDTSGSMNGQPLDKAKEAMKRCLSALDPRDAFAVMHFDDVVSSLSATPLPATPENVKKGIEYVDSMECNGATGMLKGIRAAFAFPLDPGRIRLVCLMTDGYIGNEAEILAETQKQVGAGRVFAFGVGSSVNRYLLDEMSRVGRGDVQYVRPDEDTGPAVEKFARRIAKPCLTDLSIDWGGLAVTDVYPSPLPDVFDGQPLVIFGRFEGAGTGEATLHAKAGGKEWSQEIEVALPSEEGGNPAVGTMWARARIAELSRKEFGGSDKKVEEAITGLALEFRLVSQYTSFVAIEEKVRTDEAGKTVIQPVELPEGVTNEAGWGVYDSMGVGGGSGGGGSYGGRFGGKRNLVARGGGTRATESAVTVSLRWIASKQEADGSWGGDAGQTGLALLSFEGAGYTHLSRENLGTVSAGESVKSGIRWLIGHQDMDGWMAAKGDLLGQARAATALAEAYGMTSSALFKDPAQKAIDALLAARTPAADGQLGMWILLALKSGELGGLAVPKAELERSVTEMEAIGGAPGLLAHVMISKERTDPRLEGWAKGILATLPAEQAHDFASWQVSTLALFQYDGPSAGGSGACWKTWNQALKDALIKTQAKDGHWTTGDAAGDLEATALAQLTLEVYYRYANALGGK